MQLKSCLEDIGVLELLETDDRPTFILECNGPHQPGVSSTVLVFRNQSLESYLHENNGLVHFEDWATSLSIDAAQTRSWTFGGRAWSTTIIQEKWIIVYCSQAKQAPVSNQTWTASTRRARNTSLSLPVSSPLSHKPSQIFSDCGDASQEVPSWPALEGDGVLPPKVIDWTRYYIEDLSPYFQFIKDYNWGDTRLGPMSGWPDSLRRDVVATFSSPDPRLILWGEELLVLYNEATIPRLGRKHPAALGMPVTEIFDDLWPQVANLVRPPILEGKATKVTQELLFMDRKERLEETYWNFVMTPLLGSDGYAAGVLDSFTEQTTSIIGQRRRDLLNRLSQEMSNVVTLKELWPKFLSEFEPCGADVPYALIYASDDADDSSASSSSTSLSGSRQYTLEGSVGIPSDNQRIPRSFDMTDTASDSSGIANICKRAWDLRQTLVLQSEDSTLPESLAITIPGRGWGDAVCLVIVMPIAITNNGALGFLIIAANPRRPSTDEALRLAQNLRDILAKPAWLISQKRYEEMNDSLARQLRVSTLQAARNEDKFTRLAESAPIGICTFNSQGKTLYVNDEYLEIIGLLRQYDPNSKLWDGNNNWREQVNPDDLPIIAEAWETLVMRKATSVTIEYRLRRPWVSVDKATGAKITGETWCLNKATSAIDEEDNVAVIHAWLLDVSHQHYFENLMNIRLQEAVENKRQSENFIDMVSHELRNPLSAILQSADGILTTLDETKSKDVTLHNTQREGILEAAQTIVLCAQHQKCIVDDILLLSKLDSNLLVITPDRVQPPSLIGKVLKMYESELKTKDVEAHLEVDPSFTEILHENDYVMLDPSRLLQVVINLLTNAIKFTQFMEERKITVYLGASYQKPTGDTHNLTFIQPRSSNHKNNTSLSAEWGDGDDIFLQVIVRDTGRGLGEEEIKLLFQRFSQTSPKTYRTYGGSGLGLFISRELTELQGGQIGVSSKGVGKGSTFAFYVRAKRCTPEGAMELPSSVALLTTPVPDIPADVAVAASTASMVATVIPQTSSSANLDPGLPRLSRVPTNTRIRANTDTGSGTQATQQLHVLVVEDNLINQKVMAQQLRRIGCVVHIANHGLECLEFLKTTPFWSRNSSPATTPHDANSAQVPLSVVLMDWEMPTMDGLTCVREMRKLEATGYINSHIPVIAVTANARGEQISIAMAAGMDDLVTKPFRIPELLPRIELLVSRYLPSTAEASPTL